MSQLNFDIDKYQKDQVLRDRIRAVIRGLQHCTKSRLRQGILESALANLQPVKSGTNIDRLHAGIFQHWEYKTHCTKMDKEECALTLLRQLIINWWDYLLEGTDETLITDGVDLEAYLETLEGYVENGLDKYVVAGDVRQGYWLMTVADYQKSLEEVR